jgi:spore coat-associated protein N
MNEIEENKRKKRKILFWFPSAKSMLVLGLTAIAIAVSSIGAFSTFSATTDTSSANPTYSTCSMALAGIGTNAANNRLTLGATDLVPGDTMQRTVNIKNTSAGTGCVDATSVKLTTKATACVGTCQSSLLNTDTTNGLQMSIDKCSVAWTESGTAPAYTYTCGGTTTSVLASTPIIVANSVLSNIVPTTNTDNFLRVNLSFPSTAGNTFQGLTSRVEYSFAADQRAATNK